MKRILGLFLVTLLATASAIAQSGFGELTGIVTDASGAVISGASIDLTANATGETRHAVSSSGGLYRFTALPIVGKYTLKVSAGGFKG